jgi:orotidine-5'-phosphate decarboxylase
MNALVGCPRSIIPACDVPNLVKLDEIAQAVKGVSGIGAFKVGLELVIPFGLGRVVEAIRRHSSLPVIYDHQKGGTDIPDLGPKFARAVKDSGVDAAILFPFGGAATERKWIEACKNAGLTVLVGAEMTQPEFFEDEGGFLAPSSPGKIFEIAASMGVTDFVVPGNKAAKVEHYRKLLASLMEGSQFTLYAPGFISQGGDITETGQMAGDNWHAIVGSALYNQEGVDAIREAALRLTQQIQVAL